MRLVLFGHLLPGLEVLRLPLLPEITAETLNEIPTLKSRDVGSRVYLDGWRTEYSAYDEMAWSQGTGSICWSRVQSKDGMAVERALN